MKPYHQRLSILLRRSAILLLMTLFVGLQTVHGQQKTAPRAAPVVQQTTVKSTAPHDAANGADGPLRVEGSVHDYTDSSVRLALHVTSTGDDKVTRKKPGRVTYSNITLEKSTTSRTATAQDYNSSRSNNSSLSSTTGGSDATAPANDHNTTRSNRTRSHVSDGALEHTDDWIAARATGSGLDVTLVSVTTHGRDVHSGKLTGVRQHSPVKTSRPVDAATPYIYKAAVDANGTFAFEDVAPGEYRIVVLTEGHEFRGHVTVLK